LLLMVPAVTLNVAVVAAAATVTDAGTLRRELVLVSATAAPPAGAAPLRVTVQVELAPEVRLAGEHCKPETVGRPAATVMTSFVPETATPFPFASDPTRLPSARGTDELLVAERVTVTTATTPVPITLAFMPSAMHIAVPLVALQLRVFPAAVKAGPAAKLMAATLAGA
jgi:hypothetical protein